MDRDRRDRDTCRPTRKRERSLIRSTESLEAGQKSRGSLSSAKGALHPVGFVYLGVMVLTWAGNWPLMKLALREAPPLVFVLFRLVGSLILIAPALLATRQPLLPARGERLTLFWVGQLQIAVFPPSRLIPLRTKM